jgi:hypothetical protein
MRFTGYAVVSGIAAAALLLSAVATAPAYAAPGVTEPDAAVACQAFQRSGNGGWTATAPTVLNFTNGTSLAISPGATFAAGNTIGGIEVTAVLDRHCGNL